MSSAQVRTPRRCCWCSSNHHPRCTSHSRSNRCILCCCQIRRHSTSRTHRRPSRLAPKCRPNCTRCCIQLYHNHVPNHSRYKHRRSCRRLPRRSRRRMLLKRSFCPKSRRRPRVDRSNSRSRPTGAQTDSSRKTRRIACRLCRRLCWNRGSCSCSRRCC
jgi:hypothetical protein